MAEDVKVKKYIIVPFCSDLNRGDQALTWETKKLAGGIYCDV